MRVLIVAPWFRTLAGSWGELLNAMGHEVLVVTSERHFESQPAGAPEFLVRHGPREPAAWTELARLRRVVRRFSPDVVLADEVRDPRLLAVAPRRPLVVIVHDAHPHDAGHKRPWRHELTVRAQHRSAVRFVTFSTCVRDRLRASLRRDRPIEVIPLPSEMRDEMVPALVPAALRHDFVLIGRLGPYKNVPAVFQAWTRHVNSTEYVGDRLLIIGDGHVDVALPPHAVWLKRRFTFADVVDTAAAAKGSLAFYSAGSQSGVQRLSMQLGVSCIVSKVGGLAEGLPPGEPAFAPDDIAGVATRLGELADADFAEARGCAGKIQYVESYSATRSAQRLGEVLARAIS